MRARAMGKYAPFSERANALVEMRNDRDGEMCWLFGYTSAPLK